MPRNFELDFFFQFWTFFDCAIELLHHTFVFVFYKKTSVSDLKSFPFKGWKILFQYIHICRLNYNFNRYFWRVFTYVVPLSKEVMIAIPIISTLFLWKRFDESGYSTDGVHDKWTANTEFGHLFEWPLCNVPYSWSNWCGRLGVIHEFLLYKKMSKATLT